MSNDMRILFSHIVRQFYHFDVVFEVIYAYCTLYYFLKVSISINLLLFVCYFYAATATIAGRISVSCRSLSSSFGSSPRMMNPF